jgi:predicted PolB exonuclease-like 3'-5' exonuclease
MFDRRIIAFDIETIPDPELGRRVMGIEGDDRTVVLELVERRLQETSGSTKYPQLLWQRVVCICMTTLEPETGQVEVRSVSPELTDEAGMIGEFFRLVAASPTSPRLVSWNGGGFDLPVLRYRAMKYGIAAPEFYRVDGDRQLSNYLNRYHDLHVDVMDVLSGYGASARAGLSATCSLLGLPKKSFLDRDVYEHFFAGEHRRIVEYCKFDTLSTMLVFLAWAVHTGALDRAALASVMPPVRELVRAQDYPGWKEIGETLERWPAWSA